MAAKVITFIIQLLIAVSFLQISALFSLAKECKQPLGTLVSLQGDVQVRSAAGAGWRPAHLQENFCPGDSLRVDAKSRAAVFLSSETVLRIDENSTVRFTDTREGAVSIITLFHGILHIFSHRPRSLKIITPYVNGDVEGTEFLVSVRDGVSLISVFEGVVAASNAEGRLRLSHGQSAMAMKGVAPAPVATVRPRDAVAWTLYYPDILKPSGKTARGAWERIREDLSVGRVSAARESLVQILKTDPGNSTALAFLSIIETMHNSRKQALELALRATARNPDSAAANLALSYAYQAKFNIAAALAALRRAAAANPGNGLVKARLAELLLATGDLDRAMSTAAEAASLDPSSSLSWTVLGFAHLSRIETKEAIASFSTAIRLDSAFPLARLGLGLAKIRRGDLEAGTREIEIAAALDPENALIRSYLGKAYFDEKRDRLARRQYMIAKELDPADPTPWLYDAVRMQTENRPVEALHDLQHSIALNDNRAVYRSRLLLDDDLAARSAGLGRIYTDLGFEQLASVEGVKSLQADPTNYSAHRFLADIYSTIPLHEISRASELLKSQLLQPLNINPAQPQLAEINLAILEGTGPSVASANEFTPLFLRNRISFQTSGVAGSNGTLGDETILSGVDDRISYSLGQFHYQTDGIRPNNDQNQDIYDCFIQGMLNPSTSLMTEIRYKERDFGDLTFLYDPTDFSSTLRQEEEAKSIRVGMRHTFNPGSILLATAVVSSDYGGADTGIQGFSLGVDLTDRVESQMVEVQHIYKTDGFNLQSGAGFFTGDERQTTYIYFPYTLYSVEPGRTDHFNAYSYAQIALPAEVTATVGLSGDALSTPRTDRDELNPKFGLTWQPFKSTLFRAAIFKAVARRLIHVQTVEPTMVAGFNQFFDDAEASKYWTYGAAVDQRFSAAWYGGLQYYRRDISVPWVHSDMQGEMTNREDDWHEGIGSAYVYWIPDDWIAFGLEYSYEHYVHDQYEGAGFHHLTTNRITPSVRTFFHSGISAGLQASYLDQEGQIGSSRTGYEQGSDRFWIVDAFLSYRLPKRYGLVKVQVKNLFDKRFNFFDTDPFSPQIVPARQIICSVTFIF